MTRTLTALLLAAGMALIDPAAGATAEVHDATVAPLLPDADIAETLLRQSPALTAAQAAIDAERAGSRQLGIGPNEWTVTATTARRTPTGSSATHEWDLGLERAVRWPGKQAAAEQLGERRIAAARVQWLRAWREQARALLDRHAAWLRESEAARLWTEQVRVLEEQAQGVSRRQQLGDASRLERLQAKAALTQSQAQRLAAEGRRDAARDALAQQFPGWPMPARSALPPPPSPASNALPTLDELVALDPDAQAARADQRALEAQLGLERAEQRPDPTLALRYGRALSNAERVVGIGAAFPLGGAYRAAGVEATTARLTQLEASRLALERRLAADAAGRLRERQASWASWQRAAEAAQELADSAQGLARSYQLGEGQLIDVLAARRLALDQRLAAALAAVDAWAAQWRLDLDAGRLWPAPMRGEDRP